MSVIYSYYILIIESMQQVCWSTIYGVTGSAECDAGFVDQQSEGRTHSWRNVNNNTRWDWP